MVCVLRYPAASFSPLLAGEHKVRADQQPAAAVPQGKNASPQRPPHVSLLWRPLLASTLPYGACCNARGLSSPVLPACVTRSPTGCWPSWRSSVVCGAAARQSGPWTTHLQLPVTKPAGERPSQTRAITTIAAVAALGRRTRAAQQASRPCLAVHQALPESLSAARHLQPPGRCPLSQQPPRSQALPAPAAPLCDSPPQ